MFFILSVFVPFSATWDWQIPQLTSDGFMRIKDKSFCMVTLVASGEDEISRFSRVLPLFESSADFVLMKSSAAPSLIFTREGKVVGNIPMPESDEKLLYVMHAAIAGPQAVESKEELFQYLGKVNYTIITTEENVSDAFVLFTDSISHLREINCVLVPESVMREIGCRGVCLYRNEDMTITEVNGTILNSIEPSFTVLGEERKGVKYAIFSGHKDLFNLSQRYPMFKFRYTNETSTPFMVMNSKSSFYYPVTTDNVTEYLDGIVNGTIHCVYKNQEEPPDHYINGEQYADFVGSGKSLIMYVDGPNDFIDEFISVGEKLSAIGIKSAIIDCGKNSSPREFPDFLRIPHVEYISGELSATMFDELSENNYLRFLSRFERIGLPFTPMAAPEAEIEVINLAMAMENLTDELKVKAADRIAYLQKEFSIL